MMKYRAVFLSFLLIAPWTTKSSIWEKVKSAAKGVVKQATYDPETVVIQAGISPMYTDDAVGILRAINRYATNKPIEFLKWSLKTRRVSSSPATFLTDVDIALMWKTSIIQALANFLYPFDDSKKDKFLSDVQSLTSEQALNKLLWVDTLAQLQKIRQDLEIGGLLFFIK